MRTRAERRAVLIVLAKAPEPGAVKTRLAPLLGLEEAAALHARLLERTLRTGRDARGSSCTARRTGTRSFSAASVASA